MAKFRRLPADERKTQIREAAIEVFLKKGFKSTTMEDVIAATGMSKGGVYKYYKSTASMLYDLMIEGMEFRLDIDAELINSEGTKLSPDELIVEMLLGKILDSNRFKQIYAMVLLEIAHDKKFKKLYNKIVEDSVAILFSFAEAHNIEFLKQVEREEFETLTGFINCIILGVEVLDLRGQFTKNREIFKTMLMSWVQTARERRRR